MQSTKVQLAIQNMIDQGDQLTSEGQYDEAAMMYLFAYKKSEKDNIDILIRLVEAMININKFDLALEIIDISLKEVPKSRTLYRMKALVCREKGDILNELKNLDKMISFNKYNISPYIDKARAYKKLHKQKDSFKSLDKGLKIIKKKDIRSLLLISEACIEMGATEKASKPLRIIEKQGETTKEYWLVLSKYHFSMSDTKRSLECINRSLIEDEKWIKGLAFKSEIYEQMGEERKAVLVLRKILELEPMNLRIRKKYQDLSGDLGRVEDATLTKDKYL